MVALIPIELFKEKKKQLLVEQEKLIKILKNRHKDAFDWMKENKINPIDLRIYSASIATALIVSLSATSGRPKGLDLVPHVQEITIEELAGKSEDEKASLVKKRYGFVVNRAALKYDLNPKLIFATIMIESGGNTKAIRHEPQIGDASYGLGQILYGTARGIGYEGTTEGLYDPEVSIELIARYHRRNQDVYGGNLSDEELTAVYNTGSPYTRPLPGHLNKFNKWYGKI